MNKALLTGACVGLCVCPASSQNYDSCFLGNPGHYGINLNVTEQVGIHVATGVPPNQNTSGKTPAKVNLDIPTLVIIEIADSIGANAAPTTYTPTNPILQLNLYDGKVYPATDPLLGSSGMGGAYATPLADGVFGKFAQVIIVSSGIGGSTALDHAPGGVLNQMTSVACFMVRQRGWTANPNFKFAVIYDIGPNDTGIGTTQAQFASRYAAWRASMVSYGCDFDTFVPQVSRLSGATSSAVRSAQAAVVDNVRTFAAWDTDAVTANPANVQADLTHQTGAGNLAIGALGTTLFLAHY